LVFLGKSHGTHIQKAGSGLASSSPSLPLAERARRAALRYGAKNLLPDYSKRPLTGPIATNL
jgi:hypothetical protein